MKRFQYFALAVEIFIAVGLSIVSMEIVRGFSRIDKQTIIYASDHNCAEGPLQESIEFIKDNFQSDFIKSIIGFIFQLTSFFVLISTVFFETSIIDDFKER